ncbi:nucleotidyltransferase family protein [Lutimaribacter sp. EGI FJ00015]|uniref:Nucleotidyltransferase family protein n=1 Tax=Lutimaribacter degradans TaxID=2945989 RepID=A0ACC5ZWQ6_9RHOB|nr:nucleotidyltransferase family protein [Lutimaribacter sp. EGI FJ00013]MCM2561999.1 nucleotidyltransferase family protein [Lutimaribacter sp. EGI FJ00013]MCO0612969.1 nucleotidyltransferase family protein [Lutimaribacter sp. EGI FJ00015]MCO0635831.1 nucleotidyltransferase family protein [Lutimaribacter sp. EGI FJ00014]
MRNTPDAVMLFAAGFGTRMGALTRTRPKPLIEVAGRPLLDHALDLVEQAGLSRPVVNTHYLADQIAAHLAGRGVAISHEAPDILETGGGLRHALPKLGAGPVFTLNTDAIWRGPNPLKLLEEAWDARAMDALLVTIPAENAVGHPGGGDFILDGAGRLSRGPGQIYAGAQIIKTEALADIPDRAFSLNLLWDRMLQDGRMYGLSYPGQWCDVGHPEGIAQAEEMIGQPDV